MGKYTAYGDEIDNYLEENYINKIKDSFIKDCVPIAIILFGGFGKGEGSIQLINDKPIPYNDFDFYVVTKDKLTDEQLNKISMNASHAINMGGLEIAYSPEQGYDSKKFFHVDVRCIPYNKLDKLMKTQRYYELKYGSKVIYGDKLVLDMIPEIKPSDIPVSEGLRNLFNKLHTMLLGLQKEYNEDQKNIKIFWSYKSYLSCCEALLILSNKFAPTSLDRMRIFSEIYKKNFPELFEKIPNLSKKIEIATNFKLKLDFYVDHEKIWRMALKDIMIVFEYFLRKITDCEVDEALIKKLPYTYFKPYLKERLGFNFYPAQYLLNIGYYKQLKEKDNLFISPLLNWKDVGLKIILPIYYLLKFKLENNEKYLDEAFNKLKKIIKVENKDFWYLRERALKAFGLYYQQRLL